MKTMSINAIVKEISKRLDALELRRQKLYLKERNTDDTIKLCEIHYAQDRVIHETYVLRNMLETFVLLDK